VLIAILAVAVVVASAVGLVCYCRNKNGVDVNVAPRGANRQAPTQVHQSVVVNVPMKPPVTLPPLTHYPDAQGEREVLQPASTALPAQPIAPFLPPAPTSAAAPALNNATIKQLREKAAEIGIDLVLIENARDQDDPKAALLELIRSENLSGLTMKELRKRAAAAHISADAIEDARDSDEPRAALVALIMKAKSEPGMKQGP
jgi:hypothetical protein